MTQLFGGLKNNNTKTYYERNFHGKMVSKDKRKEFPTKTRNVNLLFGSEINTSKRTLNRYAVEVGEEIRVFSLARGFDRHDQRKDVQRRKNLAEAKATFTHHLLFFSLENQNLIFLCCGSCCARFFFLSLTLYTPTLVEKENLNIHRIFHTRYPHQNGDT